jgi:hypothetical protein
MSEKMPNENTDPIWQIHMRTLMKRKRVIETAQTIDRALWEWYSNKGLEVPDWKTQEDPQWWIDYLNELGIDPTNP